MAYRVEILNLGKRPVPGVKATREEFDDEAEALTSHCTAVGEMVMRPAMLLLGADRRDEVGDDGIMAAARLTHEEDGGRVEVILRRLPDTPSA